MPCWANQDRQVMVESSDKMWSLCQIEVGNGKPLQYSCLENPMNNMKRQNDRILKEKLPRSVGAQYADGEEWNGEITPERMKRLSQSGNNVQVWLCLVVKVKSAAVKNNIA